MSKKEKSMGNSNGRITAPVGLQPDMYGVQGLIKTGTFYDVGVASENEHGTINPFAKYKPTRFNSPNGGTSWWRADDGNCGFTGFALDDGMELVQAYQNRTAWVYQPPRPGTDWCRMADFEGYNHNAKPFVTVESVDNGYERTYIVRELPETLHTKVLSIKPYASCHHQHKQQHGRTAHIRRHEKSCHHSKLKSPMLIISLSSLTVTDGCHVLTWMQGIDSLRKSHNRKRYPSSA